MGMHVCLRVGRFYESGLHVFQCSDGIQNTGDVLIQCQSCQLGFELYTIVYLRSEPVDFCFYAFLMLHNRPIEHVAINRVQFGPMSFLELDLVLQCETHAFGKIELRHEPIHQRLIRSGWCYLYLVCPYVVQEGVSRVG